MLPSAMALLLPPRVHGHLLLSVFWVWSVGRDVWALNVVVSNCISTYDMRFGKYFVYLYPICLSSSVK